MNGYGLKLDSTNRIIETTYEEIASPDMIIVKELPDGDYEDFKYINNEYVYDPLPKSRVPHNPTTEERLRDLENALCEIVDLLSEF